jgi:O-methyltransferase involved in polyketide biosynthesis
MEPQLTGVQQTLLIPLSARVVESRRPDSPFQDPEAERIASVLSADLGFYAREWSQVEAVVGRTHILDEAVRAFLAKHPQGQVVNLGAGLCTRFHRVDNGTVRWLEVDLPEVIALKRKLLPESPRYQLVAASVLEDSWMQHVNTPVLFVAEGLLMYLREADVLRLLARLCARFPGDEMWLEAISPFMLRTLGRASRNIRSTGAQFDWGLSEATQLEQKVAGLKVLAVLHPNEVHPDRWRWMRIFRYVRPVHTALKCIHVRLGDT